MADDYTADITTTGRLDSGLALGNLEVNGDHDWFKVFLFAGHNYVIDQKGSPSAGGTLTDPLVRLYNSAGTLLTSDDDSGFGFESQLAVHVNGGGFYFVDAGGFNDNRTGTYAVQLTDLGTGAATNRFEPVGAGPANLAIFGASNTAGGWNSQNTYLRAVGDVDGDGQADIIGFGNDGVYVSRSVGGGHFSFPTKVLANFGPSAGGWVSQETNPRLVGDVTGDGRADIVAFAVNGVYLSQGKPDGTFAAPTFALAALGSDPAAGGWNSFNQYPRQLADVDGDGKQDIVAFANNGVYVAHSNGATFALPTAALLGAFGSSLSAGGWISQDIYPRLVGDVNGDGRADIVAFAHDGVYVALGQANSTFSAPIFAVSGFGNDAGFTSQNLTPRQVADINGDGRADIVAFGPSGVSFALGQANGTFGAISTDLSLFGSSAAAGGWSSNDTYPRLLADVTGDGRADIIGFGQAGVFVSPSHDLFAVA